VAHSVASQMAVTSAETTKPSNFCRDNPYHRRH
jgi:hypothetical protein